MSFAYELTVAQFISHPEQSNMAQPSISARMNEVLTLSKKVSSSYVIVQRSRGFHLSYCEPLATVTT